MSYNIDTWKTKKIDGLVVPVVPLYKSKYPPSKMVIESYENDIVRVRIDISEIGGISGVLTSDKCIVVEKIELCGEGSGMDFADILMPALKLSKGHLEAVLVWEGGDSITRLCVSDGKVTTEAIEL